MINIRKQLEQAIENINTDNVLKVGVIKEARRSKDGEKSDLTIAEYAYINIMGSPTKNIPPRNFFKTTIDKNQDKWAKGLNKLIPTRGIEDSLELLGVEATADMKDSITNWKTPRNAPYTIKLKGKDTPLVDTGALHDSINYEVVKGGKQ